MKRLHTASNYALVAVGLLHLVSGITWIGVMLLSLGLWFLRNKRGKLSKIGQRVIPFKL